MLETLFYSPVLQKARWEAWRFGRCCRQVAQTQRKVLSQKLAMNHASGMGQAMGIGHAGSPDAFRSRVPITDYEYYSDAIEKCKAGDTRAMLGEGQKVLMFGLSSGTTGKPKFIPITGAFLKEYRRGWLTWGFYAYRGNSLLVQTHLLPITSSSSECLTSAGIPCGGISGLTCDSQSWITRHLFPVPRQVYQIKDPETKYYVLGRMAIEKRVGSISSANPSTVLGVFRLLNERREQIVRDVREGTLDASLNLDAHQRASLAPYLRPNPRRADALNVLMAKEGGLYPKHFWKDLTLLSNWKGGSLSRYLDFYPEFFGNTEVRDIGLIASEGRMTIPMSDKDSEGVLDVLSHFFEFVPEDSIEDKAPRTYLAHELEKGRRYFMLLTTSSGFYRYDIRDLVEVTDFYFQAPVLKFLNKGRHFSSITGEKLSEYQVVEAAKGAARKFGLPLEDYCMFPRWGLTPHYGLLVEEGQVGEKGVWASFVRELDGQLCRLNCEYQSKRSSGRLGGIGLFFVPRETFKMFKSDKIRAQGGRPEQYKHVFLIPEDGFEKQFSVLREFCLSDSVESRTR